MFKNSLLSWAKIKNMKLFFAFLLLSSIAFGQSKKKQIESLNKSLDSINYVIDAERKLHKDQIEKASQNLNEANRKSTEKITEIENTLSLSKQKIQVLNNKLDQAESAFNEQKTINIILNQKNDSLQSLTLNNSMLLKSIKEDKQLSSELLKENNLFYIACGLKTTNKNIDEYKDWLNNLVCNFNENESNCFTEICKEYIEDVTLSYWADVYSDEELISKWYDLFDLKYSSFGHPFENGQDGWQICKIKKIEPLGEFKNGLWFKITIVGGYENDKNTLIRIVKVIKENNAFKISNFLSLKDG